MIDGHMPQYPLYIVSKGRADSRFTSKTLEAMHVPYYIVVEKQEVDIYEAAINPKYGTVLELDKKFQDEYDTFDDLGYTKSKGPGPARNFVWEHAKSNGFKRHWVMDDNINGFYRFNNNSRIVCLSGALFRAMEDFNDRYTNLPMCGPNYFSFAVPCGKKNPPIIMNTRIYSCNLIECGTPYRWRGRYNEDTDISLRMLKDGLCTVQFNAFLQGKIVTQAVKGGNTAEFYAKEGTTPKSQMLFDMHPDVTRLVTKYDRPHHHVDYNVFKKNRLQRIPDIIIPNKINEYGMVCVKREELKEERKDDFITKMVKNQKKEI